MALEGMAARQLARGRRVIGGSLPARQDGGSDHVISRRSRLLDGSGSVRLGAVAAAPGSISFEAKRGALPVTWAKPGFRSGTVEKTPVYSPGGGFAPGGLLALAISAAAASPPKTDWRYPAEIIVDLGPIGPPGKALPLSGLRLR